MKSRIIKMFLGTVILSITVLGVGMRLTCAKESAMKAAANANEVGNKICPITGEEVQPGKEHKIEYKGKIYNLCCSMCEKDFKKDPEAAIKKLEAVEEDAEYEEGTDMDMDDDESDAILDEPVANQEIE